MSRVEPRSWTPDLVGGGVVLVLGLLDATGMNYYSPSFTDDFLQASAVRLVVPVALAAAVALARRHPGPVLAGCWGLALAQVVATSPLILSELALAWVAFCCARWGSRATVTLAGLSGPLAAALAVYTGLVPILPGAGTLLRSVIGDGSRTPFLLAAVLVGALVSLVPWMVGLAYRFRDRARRSEAGEVRATAQAAESLDVARLQEQQTRLARDVHDVVGHSLTVILSQAEAAAYLPDDPARLKETLATIAGSARSSLHDVRQVLAATDGRLPSLDPDHDLLSEVVERVASSGVQVVDRVEGAPQPLPPELAEVARRVLQEMLTNALRHGDRGRPVLVERHWEGDLRIEVTNACRPDDQEMTQAIAVGSGSGIDGMRARLESVGGRLDVRRRRGEVDTHTATAWLPVRAR